jgi:hypothetical protein
VSVWSDTFLRPLFATNGASAKRNGAFTKVNGVTAKTGGLSGQTPQVRLPLVRGLGLATGSGLAGQAWDYWFDRAQRTVLLLDVMREETRPSRNELFTGNKLAQGRLVQETGQDAIDLRNICSPIISFCSWGDTITPPAQAPHWILDTYPTDEDLLANEQTIIYMLPELRSFRSPPTAPDRWTSGALRFRRCQSQRARGSGPDP